MARPYSVTPILRNGHKTYTATFRDASGARVTRSLGTDDRGAAGIITAALTSLHLAGVVQPAAAPSDVDPVAARLYFGLDVIKITTPAEPEFTEEELDRMAPATAARVMMLSQRAASAEKAAARLAGEVQRLQADYNALQASAIGRAASAARRCPPHAQALELFDAELRHCTAKQRKRVYSVAKRFADQLPAEVRTPAEVEPVHVGAWLAAAVAGAAHPAVRRNRLRTILGQFFNWAARTWGFTSPVASVRASTPTQVGRARQQQAFHTVEEIEAAVKAMPPYWRALVAVLGFGGLQLEELVWLRREDYFEEDGRAYLRVASVSDGAGGVHLLKTHHRTRVVRVSTRLAGHLAIYLAAATPPADCLFPMPKDVRRRRRTKAAGCVDRWTSDYLSKYLSGVGNFTHHKRILPPGWTARSLRRSASENLPSADPIERAAFLGNDPAVAVKFYKRHDSRKVDTEV